MKRHEGLVPLSREHQKGLLLAQVLKKDAPPYRGMPTDIPGKKELLKDSYNNDLKPHFQKEEEILFPEVKNLNEEIANLINELTEDHRKIERLVDEIAETGHPKDKMDELGNLLDEHIRKEERSLFEKLQEIMPESELIKFKERF